MTILSLDRDLDRRTLTVTCQFAAPRESVWRLWADPRKLERWWGPPGYPATFTAHDLRPGGRAAYHMTSPEGEKYHGYWLFAEVEPDTRLAFTDSLARGWVQRNQYWRQTPCSGGDPPTRRQVDATVPPHGRIRSKGRAGRRALASLTQ